MDKIVTPDFISAMELIIKGLENNKLDFSKIKEVSFNDIIKKKPHRSEA